MGDKSGIKRLRESRGLSQQYMADVLGMSRLMSDDSLKSMFVFI